MRRCPYAYTDAYPGKEQELCQVLAATRRDAGRLAHKSFDACSAGEAVWPYTAWVLTAQPGVSLSKLGDSLASVSHNDRRLP